MNARPLMRLRLTTAATKEIGPTSHGRLSHRDGPVHTIEEIL